MWRAVVTLMAIGVATGGCTGSSEAGPTAGTRVASDRAATSTSATTAPEIVDGPDASSARLDELLRSLPATTGPVSAHARDLVAIAAAAGVPRPAPGAAADEIRTWAVAAGCCTGFDPVLQSAAGTAEFSDAAGWSVLDVEAVATAVAGGEGLPVVARGSFDTTAISALLGGRAGEVVTLGTPGQFDLDDRSLLRPQGQSVSFVFDDRLLIGGYDPDRVADAAAGASPLSERDGIPAALELLDGQALDELAVWHGGEFLAGAEFLLCLPRCQDAFDLVVEDALPERFHAIVMGYDHGTGAATVVWLHASAEHAERNVVAVSRHLDQGALASTGQPFGAVIVDPTVDVVGSSLVLRARLAPDTMAALIGEAGMARTIFGHQVVD